MDSKRPKCLQGFTLIELMIVVSIIGILSSIAVPVYKNYLLKAEANAVMSLLRSLQTNIDLEILETGSFPSQLSTIASPEQIRDMGELHLENINRENGDIRFVINSDAYLKNKTITFTRSSTGWRCTHNTEQKLKGCESQQSQQISQQ
ncbi:pilin [Vibrio ziniensis]|uniref:Pilin n=1 Tax=Vibrio ziniensis TaxID=2711221 RepID=A0A6G7CFJ9_9VIBR|nr:pilin [Vibrio ziniensis]QIH40895.1 pilin [Vibrio ziniensis]